MRASAIGALLIAATLAAAGCGGGGGTKSQGETTGGGRTNASAKRVVTSAVRKFANARAARMSFTITYEIDDPKTSLTFPGEGVFDYANRTRRVTMDYGEFLALEGKSEDGKLEVLVNGDVSYVKYPVLTRSLHAATPWIRYDTAELRSINGIDVGALRAVGNADPSQTLDFLKAVGTVHEEGSEEIDGVETMKYHATVVFDRWVDLAPPAKRDEARAAVEALRDKYGISELPIDVWVDGDGLPRRLYYEFEVKSEGSKSSVKTDFSDYGIAVDAEPPPADQVTDLSELAG